VTATYSRTTGETVLGSPYTISATLSPAAVLSNYSITYNTANFTIDAKAASVTPNAASKIYGAADPAFTGTLTGFLAADGVTATYSRTAGETVLGSPYTISATLSPAAVLSNYSITYNTANFTITPRDASVTPNAASKIYGAADPAFTGTLTGFLAADGVTATYNRTTGETVLGSPYTISATLSPAAVLSNYSITYNTANFTIDAKTASVTPNAASKTYGDADPAFTGTLTGFLAADGVTATYSRTAGETVLGSPYTISATLSPAAVLSNYSITYNTANFTITPRDASVTADNQIKTYGDDNPPLTAVVTGTVNGDMLNYSLATTAVKFSNVGDYAITIALGSNPNYTVSTTDGNLHISPKVASVTADDKTKTYGDDNPALTATVVGEVTGGDPIDYSLSTTAVKFSNVADYPITVALGLNPNYNVTSTNGTLHINPKTASVTADNKTKTYGDDNPALTATVTGTVNGDTLNYSLATTAVKFSGVGDYAITVTLGSNPNYTVTKTDGNLHINPKTASVTADNKTKTYGDDNPALTATVAGTVNGDTLNYTLATTAVKFSGVGDYAITVTLGSNPNYTVSKTDGNLHINPKAASVTADNKAKTYGDANPALTATVTGTVNGDTLNYSLATTAVLCSSVGPYPITVTLGSNPNYTVTPTNGTLTINKKHLTVKADDKSKVYNGSPFTAFTVTITGFTCGDTVAVVSGSATYTGDAVGATLPGTYTITPQLGTLSAANYDFTPFNNGTLTIGYGTCTGSDPGGVILQPINADGSSIFPRSGRTVPVKFKVCDVNGNSISDPTVVFAGTGGQLTMLSAVRGQIPNPDESQYNDIPDVAFRYAGGFWIFNMATSNLNAQTTYTFRINLKYGSILFTIAIK
jgi:hypothetical protein